MMVNSPFRAQKRNQLRAFIFLFPHLFFILLKFLGKKCGYKSNKIFSWLWQNNLPFLSRNLITFAVFWEWFAGKKKICSFLWGFCAFFFFFCHSGIEVVSTKALKCGIMALSTIAVPFALAEGFKPCWQIQRTSYSASSALLSKLLLSKTINHSPSITIPTIVLDRYPWPCGLVLCILQFQAILASLGRNPFI